MLNQFEVQNLLPNLIRHTLSKNTRRFSFNVVGFNQTVTNANSFGFNQDKSFIGKVVAYDEENGLMIVKHGRKAHFSVIDLEFVTNQPQIGCNVKVTPYRCNYFEDSFLSENIIHQDGSSEILLCENRLHIPIGSRDPVINRLIDEINFGKADEDRKGIDVLVDNRVCEFEVIDERESKGISFIVNTEKHRGKVILKHENNQSFICLQDLEGSEKAKKEVGLHQIN